jgi:hypothetical protein
MGYYRLYCPQCGDYEHEVSLKTDMARCMSCKRGRSIGSYEMADIEGQIAAQDWAIERYQVGLI